MLRISYILNTINNISIDFLALIIVMTNPKNTPNLNSSIDPNDPYSSIQQEQPILRDPESDIIAKAMQYYNTEATELSSQAPAIPAIPAPITPVEIPTNFYNHDYHDGVNQNAEAHLNNLYQQSSIGKIETPTTQVPVASPGMPVPDSNNVYESVTYPEANFQNYKSVYNPNNPNPEAVTPIISTNETNSDLYLNSPIVTTSLQNTEIPFDSAQAIEQPRSPRLLWIIIGLILISMFIGLGGYTWWIASQQNKSGSKPPINSTSSQSGADATGGAESSRSVRSVAVVFNDPNGPKPADIAKKDNEEIITPEFLKQNFEADKVKDEKCQDESICGKDIDNDKDGLKNIQEQAYRTDPNKADTDTDGIADGDEVNIYNTDPTKSDSTNSGYSDFSKIKTCNDPAFKFTNTPNKFSPERQKQLADNIIKFQLHETTINSLKAIGATNTDLTTGTIAESCSPVNVKL